MMCLILYSLNWRCLWSIHRQICSRQLDMRVWREFWASDVERSYRDVSSVVSLGMWVRSGSKSEEKSDL